jgi:hypothetical protein
MQASRTYFRRRETNEVPLENEKGPPRGALNATRTQQPGGTCGNSGEAERVNATTCHGSAQERHSGPSGSRG